MLDNQPVISLADEGREGGKDKSVDSDHWGEKQKKLNLTGGCALAEAAPLQGQKGGRTDRSKGQGGIGEVLISPPHCGCLYKTTNDSFMKND